jgi:lipopolysaccharide export system permease protein
MATSFPSANKPPFNPLSRLTFGIPVMDRYILGELIMPFLFGVGAFSSIGVAIGVLFDLVRRITEAGLPVIVAMQVFLLKLPYFISLSLPMSILLACLMVYGRLSTDSELIALRSCGVSIMRLIAPALALGLIMTGVTFAFNEAVVPAANLQATITLDRALKKQEREPNFRERNVLYQEFRGGSKKRLSRLFYAEEFDGKQMKDLTILDFSQSGLNQIVVSNSAAWNPEQKTWDFYDGTTYVVDENASYRNIVRFDHQQIQLPRTPLDIATATTDPIEMNIAQIQKYLAIASESGNQKDIRKLRLRIDQKIAFPFTCVVFALVGSTLGVQPQRPGRRATGFGISLIIIIFYYLFTSICEAIYQSGTISSVMAAWLPVLCILGFGTYTLVRMNR